MELNAIINCLIHHSVLAETNTQNVTVLSGSCRNIITRNVVFAIFPPIQQKHFHVNFLNNNNKSILQKSISVKLLKISVSPNSTMTQANYIQLTHHYNLGRYNLDEHHKKEAKHKAAKRGINSKNQNNSFPKEEERTEIKSKVLVKF